MAGKIPKTMEPSSRFWTPSPSLDGYGVEGGDEVAARPPIIGRIMAMRKEMNSQPQQPEGFYEFQKHVQENDVQLERFDFLKMSVFYEGNMIGPSDAALPKDGARAVEMVFNYYAGRRQADAIVGGKDFTFADIQEANSTIDMSELNKFMKDFFPGVFTRQELSWLFKMTNQVTGVQDDNVSALDYQEFLFLLVHIGMQLYSRCSPREIALRMGRRIGLDDPKVMRRRLDDFGRMDAGFGAWKGDQGHKPQRFDRAVRHQLGADALKNVLNYKEMMHCMEIMEKGFPALAVTEWLSFPGKYIAMAFPTEGARKHNGPRFKIVIRNMAARNIQIYNRFDNLPMLSLTQLPPAPIAPGMDFMIEVKVEHSVPGVHVGGIIFSAEEMGPEIFRCPVYLRIVNAMKSPMGESLVTALAQAADIEVLREKFQASDPEGRGQVTTDDFNQVMEVAGKLWVHAYSDLELDQLVAEADVERGLVDYDDFLHGLEVRREKLQPEGKGSVSGVSIPRSEAGSVAPSKSFESGGADDSSVGDETGDSSAGMPIDRSLKLDRTEQYIAQTGYAVPLAVHSALMTEEYRSQVASMSTSGSMQTLSRSRNPHRHDYRPASSSTGDAGAMSVTFDRSASLESHSPITFT
mmetsp:Transcript_28033/g.66939  ORF Transcript_28033/g.66939 Transcript_28033/m.66939 type:complete len:634 (-) Transcript_28033:34-1935(-)